MRRSGVSACFTILSLKTDSRILGMRLGAVLNGKQIGVVVTEHVFSSL